MNLKYLKRIVAFALIMMLSMAYCAAVAEESVGAGDTKSDPFFHSYTITLSEDPGDAIHMTFSVDAKQTSDILGVNYYRVYRKIDGEWVYQNTYSGSLKSDTAGYTFSKRYYGVNGGTYRVKATFYCKKYDGSSRSVTMTSSSIRI